MGNYESTILGGHASCLTSIAFNFDGSMLISASTDRTIRLWNVDDGECVCILKGHTGYVNSIAFSLDHSTLASASCDETIKFWDLTSFESAMPRFKFID